MVPLASAHLESDVNSRWAYTIPTIDGVISPGEWADATVRDFTLYMRERATGILNETLSARFYVKNNLTHIDAAVQIFNEDYQAIDAGNRWDGFALLFEDDHDGSLENGDNGEGVTTWAGSIFPRGKNDLYYDAVGGFWDADLNVGKTNDGALDWSHTNPIQGAVGNYTLEMVIPLVGADGDAYDLAIATLPKTVGFKIWFWEMTAPTRDGVYPDSNTTNINFDETFDGTTFGNLILHPRYTLTISVNDPTMGTTNPAPGVYLNAYGWGEVQSVLAIKNPGYVLDHWELDTVNVGSTNPYSVTMDMNHTLKAVFKVAPPVVGGMAAPIVVQISKPDLLTPLIWLASTIMFSTAVTVFFVKLKKKK